MLVSGSQEQYKMELQLSLQTVLCSFTGLTEITTNKYNKP